MWGVVDGLRLYTTLYFPHLFEKIHSGACTSNMATKLDKSNYLIQRFLADVGNGRPFGGIATTNTKNGRSLAGRLRILFRKAIGLGA